jgi:hypothetical protein
MLVVHLGDFDVEVLLGQDAGGETSEPEQGVHPHGIVRSVNDADGFGGLMDRFAFGVRVTSGADDEAGAVFERRLDHGGGERVDREVDGTGGHGNGGVQVLTGVMGGRDGNSGKGGGFDDGLAHAAGFSSDEKVRHKLKWRTVG